MIDYIRGIVAETEPTRTVIEAGGVGYEIFITLPDYGPLQHAQQKEESVRLYIHEIIREDAQTLFGFGNKETREIFRLLISVSGVGPGSARLILSAMSVSDLQESVETGDATRLKSVKGIGIKTAQRILVDLKGKMPQYFGIVADKNAVSDGTIPESNVAEDAVAALQILGYTADASRKVVRSLLKQDPTLSTEQLIRASLRHL